MLCLRLTNVVVVDFVRATLLLYAETRDRLDLELFFGEPIFRPVD
jgi:hypothetical protein